MKPINHLETAQKLSFEIGELQQEAKDTEHLKAKIESAITSYNRETSTKIIEQLNEIIKNIYDDIFDLKLEENQAYELENNLYDLKHEEIYDMEK